MVCQVLPISPSTTRTAVLIVEDERISRRALSSLLERCGFQPQPFRSAEEALGAVLSGTHPRFALVDLDLPGMDGLDLISRLESLDPSIFPILITATDQEILSAKLHERPVTYLRKPVNFDTLLNLLTERQHRQ
jgi:two-component system C4-dicarboxylate transport response regulator DctD